MVEHGVTGFLGKDDDELAHYAAMLTYDEELRLQMALAARRRLVEVLANPRVIMDGWKQLFTAVSGDANG